MCNLHIYFDKAKKLAKQLSSEVINAFACFHCFYCWQNQIALKTSRLQWYFVNWLFLRRPVKKYNTPKSSFSTY